jgi:hypothetical protein
VDYLAGFWAYPVAIPGTFYQVEADLIGINGTILSVITVWLERQIDGKFQFVTLKPSKRS